MGFYMSTLEDKILGEKRHYYCSSSESEDYDSGNEKASTDAVEVDPGPPPLNPSDGEGSVNTGPKGVIKDWQTYKQIEAEQRAERERERVALIQKLSLTCRSNLDEEKDPEFADLLEDPFLLEYSKRRMEEMMQKVSEQPKFGTVITLSSGEEFLDAIDRESKRVPIIVHLYDDKVSDCDVMNCCLNEICKEYPEVKFCRMSAAIAGVSKHFKVSGVPALLVYKNGTLVGNFVGVTKELGNEFSVSDVENFLIENGILLDKSCIPSIIRQGGLNNLDNEVD